MDSALPRVAVLCGGAGSRLGELTKELPKPMIAIGGRPYLERVVHSFSERGFGEFVFLTGFRHEVIESHFGDGERFGVSVTYSRELEPLGTGGAVREARPLLGKRFLLTYGDVLRHFDYDQFVRRHPRNCVAAYPRIAAGNTAVERGLVVVYDKRRPELPFIDAGFSLMHSDVLDLLPASVACSFEETVFPHLAGRRELECEIVDRDFFDIGTPDELQRTRAALEGR